MASCIFCLDNNGSMNQLTSKGRKSLIDEAVTRNDNLHSLLKSDQQLHCHLKCRLKYLKSKTVLSMPVNVSTSSPQSAILNNDTTTEYDNEPLISPAATPDINDVPTASPTALFSSSQQCSNCKREGFALESYNNKIIHRHLSLIDKNGPHELCFLCKQYLTNRLPKRSLWHYGWPTVIAYLLANDKFKHIRQRLWLLLPELHRTSWLMHADTVGLSITESQSIFEDYTDHLNCWFSRITSGVIADFISANDDYAFPCVKCPAGCFAYVDECHYIPFHHFLAWKFDVVIFDGNGKCFTGARQDWPTSSLQLGVFNVKPGLIATENQGLCVMVCNGHSKQCGLSKPIVHVPLNPVLGDKGFQSPDTLAAGVLTPNVIRAGRMGKWTNSNHVVAAIGGYTGISSSSIAEKIDSTIQSYHLSASSYLTMEHRSDVLNTMQHRFAMLQENEFERGQLIYSQYYRPSEETLCASLSGATFVDIESCWLMQERLFNRDVCASPTTIHEANNDDTFSSSLSMTFVHSTNRGGCKPVDLTSRKCSSQENPTTNMLLKLLIHCPSIYDALLRRLHKRNNMYIAKLLYFVHYISLRSNRYSKRFRNAADCEQQTRIEMQKNQLAEDDDEVAAIMLLEKLSSNIAMKTVKDTRGFDEFTVDSNVNVMLIRRESRHRWRQIVPHHIGDFSLVQVFLQLHLGIEQYYFRWKEAFQFWHVRVEKGKQVAIEIDQPETMQTKTWKLLVYIRSNSIEYINQQQELNLQGQRKMRCDHHNIFLVKQSLRCPVSCCVQSCNRKARWRCNGRGSPCPNAVCLAHGQAIVRGDNVINVECGMIGQRLSNVHNRSAIDNAEVDDDDYLGEEEPMSDDGETEGDDTVLVPLGIDEVTNDQFAPALHTRKDMIPIYDVNRRLPSHYLWNSRYNVMKRAKNQWTNVQCNAILEHVVATSGCASVSLLYPEAQLFPRIFWHSQSDSVTGALPSFMLNCASDTLSGIASLEEHLYVRMRDGDLLTAKENGYWHLAFDLMLNRALYHTSSQLVFKRGLEFLVEQEERNQKTQREVREAKLPMDEAEAVRRVKELASLLKKGKWTYFLTITVNDSETPGVRQITKAMRHKAGDDNDKFEELTIAFLPFVLRTWERFVKLFFQELIMRNPAVIGPVKNLFYRFEFQGAGSKGNKPHVHAGITLVDEPETVSVARICCSSLSFHSTQYGTDFETLKSLGVVASQGEYDRWMEIVSSVNHHDCSMAQFRCMKATNAEGDKICRYHRQPPMPITAINGSWFEQIAMPYSDDTYKLLSDMGLATRTVDAVSQSATWAVDECLSAGKWHYYARPDEFFLPSIPLVSAICRSSTNVDVCDRKFQVSYLVKYVAGKEEHQLVNVNGTKDISEVTVHTEEHAHEKITHCSRILNAKEKVNPHQGREISLPELMWFNLSLPYTYCTAEFVHVSTLPLENRTGVLHEQTFSKHFIGEDNTIHPIALRMAANLPPWRLFLDEQVAHIEDYSKSRYCLDPASAFNIRPPELRFFDDLSLYSECFLAVGTQKTVILPSDVSKQCWFDGASRRIMLRSSCINVAIAFAAAKAQLENNVSAAEMMHCVFEPIERGDSDALKNFVHMTSDKEVVAVVSLVKPWDRCKFVTHLCMSIGTYTTENSVFCNGDLITAFYNSGLLPHSTPNVTRADVLAILKKYVVRDLAYHPISARQFEKYLRAADDTLTAVLVNGVLGDYTPCLSEVMLKEQATALIAEKEATRKSRLLAGLSDDSAVQVLLPPGLGDASLDSPLSWQATTQQVDGISDDAHCEQSAALAMCVQAIDAFLQPNCCGVKFPCLVGRPGSGKSHVLKIATAYAISKGLQVELMSWTSERARKLGGNHLHLIFPLPVNKSTITYASSIADDCIERLKRDPIKKLMLKRTDVFVFEEIGTLSAEYYAALDNVLRAIMENALPWGGKLLMCCGDAKQLPPITGRPIWASPNMCAMMSVFVFTADVRARDAHLQWLNDQCRRQLSDADSETVAEVVMRECRFESSWVNVPDLAVRIVSTKAAEQQVLDEFLACRPTESFVAVDEVQNGTVWQDAGTRISKYLNRNVYEYDVCRLYKNAIVRMTCNERHGPHPFSQGQVAVVVELPCESTALRLRLRLAPPGVRNIDVDNIPADWPEVLVGMRTTPPSVVGANLQMGRRTQYPVRYYFCTTIHRIQGDTVPLLATQLSSVDPKYRLWQKEQFVVLISRVQRCRDIIFVGNAAETRLAIVRILAHSTKWDNLVDQYLTALNVAVQPAGVREILLDSHPFLPVYRELPSATCGYVYLIASTARANVYYIGETDNLKRCLRNHNTGYGSKLTADTTLHPWGIFAFVVGFEACNKSESDAQSARREFVETWTNAAVVGNLEAQYQCGREIVEDWTNRGFNLVIVKCGEVRQRSAIN